MGARPLLSDRQAGVRKPERQAQGSEVPEIDKIARGEVSRMETMTARFRGKRGHKRHGRKGR